MNRNIKKSIFLILMFVILISNECFSVKLTREQLAKSYTTDVRTTNKEVFNSYIEFITHFYSRKNYHRENAGCLFLDSMNNKLMIGHSCVIMCSGILGNERLKELGYDITGFGGAYTKDFATWLSILAVKKYNKVVIWGANNDINLRVGSGADEIDEMFVEETINTLSMAKTLLLDEKSKVVVVLPKTVTYNESLASAGMNREFIVVYNKMVEQYRRVILEIVKRDTNIVAYDSKYEMTEPYSYDHFHYNIREPYEEMLRDIDNGKYSSKKS